MFVLRQVTSVLFVAALAGASVISRDVASTSGNLLDSVSQSCKTTIQGMLVSSETACLNLGSFLFSSLTANNSIPDVANTWLTGLCEIGSCSDATIASVVQNVIAGCSEDLNKYGIGNVVSVDQMIQYAQQYYPTVRQIACLRDDGVNQLCVPKTLSDLQSVIGSLGPEDLQLNTLYQSVQKVITSASSLACTGCIKQAYNIVAKVFPFPDLLAQASGPITDTCGTSFIDGADVDGVSETAQAGVFVSKNQSSASALKPLGVLAAIASSFAIISLI